MADRDVARTTVQLWQDLQSNYGLKPHGYDRALVDEIRSTLGLPDGPMPAALRRHAVKIEALLHAILLSLQPLAAMLSDLLQLFERAEATMADKRNLKVVYDFSSRRPPLPFDLDEFREWTRRTTQAVGRAPATLWTADRLWELAMRLSEHAPADARRVNLRSDVYEWLGMYEDLRRWPSAVPVVQVTRRVGLDRVLRQVNAVAASVLRQSRAISTDRNDLARRRQLDRPGSVDEIGPSGEIAQVDDDGWLGEIVRLVQSIAEEARTDPQFDIDGVERDMSMLLDALPTTTVTVRSTRTVLDEILSLPSWTWRHEVYAAWVFTQIVSAVNPKLCALHPDNEGRLSFSYRGRGSHLATIYSPVHGPVAVWAELRTPLANPVGKSRTRNVQPDYTLLAAPVTAATGTCAVVECKQYQKASTRHFAEALTDYARAHPSAHVALVNYGPASDRVRLEVEAPERDRCSIVERLRPDDQVARERFANWLRSALDLPAPGAEGPGEGQGRDADWATITLEWSDRPRDLDLAVILDAEEPVVVNFAQMCVHEPCLAWLDRDVRDGRGPETITIAQPIGPVDVVVTRFSADGSLATSGATVTIRTPRAHAVVHCVSPDQEEWRAARILQDGEVIIC